MNNIERMNPQETVIGASEAAVEQSEKLRKLESSSEKNSEKSGEQLIADARKETESVFAKESSSERHKGGEPTASPSTIRKITKREKDRAYKQTLVRVQSEMSAPARTFSKILHAPIIERTSEVIGSTAARPNALLTGSVMAFTVLTIVYFAAHNYGYRLSGFEMIASYGLGWVLGLMGDYIKVMMTTGN